MHADAVFDTPRWRRRMVLSLLVALLGAGAVGNALTPMLLRESPALLLAVHSSYPQMGLASVRLDPVLFVAVAGLRRWVGEMVAFATGRVFGAEALAWYADRRGGRRPPLTDRLHGPWASLRDAAALLVPHPLVSAVLGAVRMPPLRFAVLKLVGTLLWVTAVWYVSAALDKRLPLSVIADFVEANAVLLTILAVLALVGGWLWQRRDSVGTQPGAGTDAADASRR